MKGESSAQQSA